MASLGEVWELWVKVWIQNHYLGLDIDCGVQKMALALRYHYSSIDRCALKSKSHLVAQAIVWGSGDRRKAVSHGCCSFFPCSKMAGQKRWYIHKGGLFKWCTPLYLYDFILKIQSSSSDYDKWTGYKTFAVLVMLLTAKSGLVECICQIHTVLATLITAF